MIVEFLPEAKSELLDAVAYYEGELNGLGQRLWVGLVNARIIDANYLLVESVELSGTRA